MRTTLHRPAFFLFILALAVPGFAGAAEREVLGRIPIEQAAGPCTSALQPMSALPSAEAELTDLLADRADGPAIGDLLAQAGLEPALGQAAFAEEQGRALYLVPLATAEPDTAHVALVVREGGEAAAFLLTMRAGGEGEPQHLSLSTLDGSAVYGLDLDTGVLWAKGLDSVSQPAMADVLSCLWNAIVSGLPSWGTGCVLYPLISTCTTNPSGCLGAVQTTLTRIACVTGVNIVRNALSCFSSTLDILPPVISSLSPADNTTVDGTFNISCSASDTSGLQTINLLVESVLVRSCSSSPCSSSYTVNFSTPNNRYRVSCLAMDQVGNSASRTNTVTVRTSGNTLQSGVPVSGLSGSTGSERLFRIAVPSGRSRLEVRTSGGTGDVDLYVRRGAPPTLLSYNCGSAGFSTTETCAINNPSSGDWYILLKGSVFRTYSGVTVVASY